MPLYLGQQGGLEWFDTENGPMGLMPSMANQYRGQIPGFGANDMAGAGGPLNPAAGVTAMPRPTSSINQGDVGGAPTMVDAPPPSGAIGSVTGFGRGAPGYSPTEAGQPMANPMDAVRELPAIIVDNGATKGRRGAAKARARDAAAIGHNPGAMQGGGAGGGMPGGGQAQGGGFDGSLESAIGEGMRAYDAQGRAIMDTAALDAQDAEAASGMLEQGEAKRLALQAQHDAQREREAQQLATYQNELGRMVEEHTKKEVDRGRLWKSKSTGEKIGLGLAVALAGLGSAMKRQGDKNPALDIVMNAIEADVSDQMNAIQKSGADIQMRQGMLQGFVQSTGNAEAARGMAMARGIADVEQQIKVAMSKTASPRALANGQMMLGELGAKRAEYIGNGAQALFGRDMQVAQFEEQKRQAQANERAAAASRAQSDRHHRENMQLELAKLADSAAKAGESEKAAATRAAADGLRKFGVGTPKDGSYLLQPEGVAMMAQADKLAAEAAKLPADQQAAAMAQAEQMRADAVATHGFQARNEAAAAKVGETMASAQTIADVVEKVDALRAKHGPKWLRTTEGTQALKTYGQVLALTLKDAYQTGALDKGSMEVMQNITGGDPSKFSAGDVSTFLGTAGNSGHLEALVDAIGVKASNDLRSAGYRGDWRPVRAPRASAQVTQTQAAARSIAADDTFDGGAFSVGGAVGSALQDAGRLTSGQRTSLIGLRTATLGGDKAARAALEQLAARGGSGGPAAEHAARILADIDTVEGPEGGPISRVGMPLGKIPYRYPNAAR